MDRELTKTDVRDIIKRGLQQTQGSYRKLAEMFHLKGSDYKRLLAFLYQHDCHLPFHPFREEKKGRSEDRPFLEDTSRAAERETDQRTRRTACVKVETVVPLEPEN
jgi:hypothetical protein